MDVELDFFDEPVLAPDRDRDEPHEEHDVFCADLEPFLNQVPSPALYDEWGYRVGPHTWTETELRQHQAELELERRRERAGCRGDAEPEWWEDAVAPTPVQRPTPEWWEDSPERQEPRPLPVLTAPIRTRGRQPAWRPVRRARVRVRGRRIVRTRATRAGPAARPQRPAEDDPHHVALEGAR